MHFTCCTFPRNRSSRYEPANVFVTSLGLRSLPNSKQKLFVLSYQSIRSGSGVRRRGTEGPRICQRHISLGGCYIAITFPFPVASKVSIAIWLDDRIKIWTDGIVISSDPSTGMA